MVNTEKEVSNKRLFDFRSLLMYPFPMAPPSHRSLKVKVRAVVLAVQDPPQAVSQRLTLLVFPVPIFAAFEDACVHFVADKKVGVREVLNHGVIEAALVFGFGQFLFCGH